MSYLIVAIVWLLTLAGAFGVGFWYRGRVAKKFEALEAQIKGLTADKIEKIRELGINI